MMKVSVRLFRVKGTGLHLAFDHHWTLVALDRCPAIDGATVVDRLDIEPEGRSYLSDDSRTLIVDAYVLSEIITLIHTLHPNDGAKANHDRLLKLFPGSLWFPHMLRGTIVAYLSDEARPIGDNHYFAACARRQIAAH